MRRILSAVALASTLALGGCGESDPPATGSDDSPSPTPSATATEPTTPSPTASATESPKTPQSSPTEEPGTTVDITIAGGEISPNGERLEADVGEPVTLRITADSAGELHVHSAPEQEIPYDTGKTTAEVVIERPGVVDIEDHDAGIVVVQLQVS